MADHSMIVGNFLPNGQNLIIRIKETKVEGRGELL